MALPFCGDEYPPLRVLPARWSAPRRATPRPRCTWTRRQAGCGGIS